jgi:hypothetical protein
MKQPLLVNALPLGLALLLSSTCTRDITSSTAQRPPQLTPDERPPLSLKLERTPRNPTTNSTVSLSVTASEPAAIASIAITVDDNVVQTCVGGSCTYTSQLSAGPHSYGAGATLVAGNEGVHVGSGTFNVWQAPDEPISTGVSPHWSHMRTATNDYRIHYVADAAARTAEYDWAASRFDVVVGGRLDEYKQRNPQIRHFTYEIIVALTESRWQALDQWLPVHGYVVENAYLHTAGTSKSPENRVHKVLWNSDRYLTNPGDPGYRAWWAHHVQALTAVNSQGNHSDGLVIDELGSGGMARHVPAVTLEYASHAAYFADFRRLLSHLRPYNPSGFMILNQANYFNKAEDRAQATEAGGSLTEFVNTPFGQQKWADVDYLRERGVTVAFYTGVSSNTKGMKRHDVNPGNYDTIAERVLMWEYASYLMVVDPTKMDAVWFMPYGLNWSVPMSATWLRAFETDVGFARGPRRLLHTGTDGAGLPVEIWQREFENALVLIRPRKGSGADSYAEDTAVYVSLPAGPWRLLLADGAVTDPVATVQLRNAEAAILIR